MAATIAPVIPLPADMNGPTLAADSTEAQFAAITGLTVPQLRDLFAARERLGGGCGWCAHYAALEEGTP